MASTEKSTPLPLSVQLNATHAELLAVHKALLDHERIRYERERGPISSPGELLQLLINDAFFAWLRPLSLLITQIDEYLASKTPPEPRAGQALLTHAITLLIPDDAGSDFQRQYQRTLQASPDVALAHGLWKRTASHFDRDPRTP